MNEPIDISKLDKAEVLAALYNASRMQGISFLANTHKGAKDAAWAQRVIDARGYGQNLYFDYINGRVMKINLGRDLLEVRLFDRDNGEGAAARALEPLFAALSQNADVVAPPPLESEGSEIEALKGGCPPTSCSHLPLPVYYVGHPDGSFSVADPQPVTSKLPIWPTNNI